MVDILKLVTELYLDQFGVKATVITIPKTDKETKNEIKEKNSINSDDIKKRS